jgi:AraC-like DNA-binding protein
MRTPESESAHPVNESARAAASNPLRSQVAWYTGYRQAGGAPATHRGLPSPYLTLIFTLHDPLDIAQHADPTQPADRYDALLGGLHARPVLITHPGYQSGIQVAVSPLAARALFGMPAGELAAIDVHADAILGRESERIREQMQAADTWTGRFSAVDAALRARALAQPSPETAATVPAEVARAWRLLLRTGGAIPISALADEVGWSTRHLAARFQVEIGLSPKAAARVIRFHRARRGLTTAPNLAALAVQHGYFDQAHLDREFRVLAGCTPTEWLATEGYIATEHTAANDADPTAEFRNVQAPHSQAA